MDERVKFIARVLNGEPMSRLCEEFSISRRRRGLSGNRLKNGRL